MAALTDTRDTKMLSVGTPDYDLIELPVLANVKIFQGALVVKVTASGLARPGTAATGLEVVGRAEATSDNTGGADGATTVRVRRGIFKFANHSLDLCDTVDVNCFVQDDQTVRKTNNAGANSGPAKVQRIDSDGVFIRCGV